MQKTPSTYSFVFFGTPEIAVTALTEMAARGHYPGLVVTKPDTPVGRKHVLTPPPVKAWAKQHDIPVLQPQTLAEPDFLDTLKETAWDFFTVFAYGKIIPNELLALPTSTTINAHPSLLPKFRGASPLRSTLLYDLSAAGVTIIDMDEELDHGPILIQEPIPLTAPIPGREFDTMAGKLCGDLLIEAMDGVVAGTLTATPQEHNAATYCNKITKDMAELTLDPQQLPTGTEAFAAYQKICAFDGWPGAFFMHNGQRIKINEATYTNDGILTLVSVTPAGKNPQPFTTWLQQQK